MCQTMRQRDHITTEDRWREKRKERGYGEKGSGEDIGRHGGGELSEHPILEEWFFRLG